MQNLEVGPRLDFKGHRYVFEQRKSQFATMVGLYVADAAFESYRQQAHFRYARLMEDKKRSAGALPQRHVAN